MRSSSTNILSSFSKKLRRTLMILVAAGCCRGLALPSGWFRPTKSFLGVQWNYMELFRKSFHMCGIPSICIHPCIRWGGAFNHFHMSVGQESEIFELDIKLEASQQRASGGCQLKGKLLGGVCVPGKAMSNWRKKNRKETRLVLFLSLRLMLWKSLKQARHETRQWIKFPQPRPVSDTFNSFHPARPLKPFSLQTLGFTQLHPLHCCRHFPNEITHETNREQGRNWSGSSSQIVPSWQRAVRWRKKLQDCRNWKGHVWGMPLCPCLLHAATLKVKLSFWQGAAGGCPAALLRLILSA